MIQTQQKQRAAQAALDYIIDDAIIGVGTGSTVDFFIEALAQQKQRIAGTVASSTRTQTQLKQHGIPVFDLTAVDEVAVYIDGADEINPLMQMIKGGGGALTREKIIACCAKQFVCIADSSKYVKALGDFPVAIEVIPMARSYIARQLLKQFDADPVYRDGFVTDNGNCILDVHNLPLQQPIKVEQHINNITGVVACGLFATCTADVLLLANDNTVETIKGSGVK